MSSDIAVTAVAPKGVRTAIIALAGAAGVAGTVLYLASYFWGIFILLAAGLLYLVYRKLGTGNQSLKSIIAPFVRTMSVPVIGILIALIVGGVIMLISGFNPVQAYGALFYGGFVRNWTISILNAVPLIFTGLGVAFAFKAGLFNIGAEGQYYVGTMAATVLGLYLNIPGIFAIPVIFILGGAASAAYNYVPAVLKHRTGAHEVITTMMFAHIARLLSPVVIRAFGGDPATSAHPYVTDEIFQSNWLPLFQSFLSNANYRLHTGILIAIATALIVHYVINHTKIGFEIRAIGFNKDAARAQGIPVGSTIVRALMISGLLAGLSGVTQVLGLTHKMFEELNAGYGWNGIAVALLASNNPIAVVFTALLWGALDAGGQYMQRNLQTPNSIVEIIKGIILFLLVARYVYTYAGNWIAKRHKQRHAAAATATAITTR